MIPFSAATAAALTSAGALFYVGLLLGVWKYIGIRRSPQSQAPEYVNIAHRAALMYAFACVLMAALAQRNALPPGVALLCVQAMVATFVVAIGSYVLHGALRDTDNQFRPPYPVGPVRLHSAVVDAMMVTKAGVELLAAALLLWGFLAA